MFVFSQEWLVQLYTLVYEKLACNQKSGWDISIRKKFECKFYATAGLQIFGLLKIKDKFRIFFWLASSFAFDQSNFCWFRVSLLIILVYFIKKMVKT